MAQQTLDSRLAIATPISILPLVLIFSTTVFLSVLTQTKGELAIVESGDLLLRSAFSGFHGPTGDRGRVANILDGQIVKRGAP